MAHYTENSWRAWAFPYARASWKTLTTEAKFHDLCLVGRRFTAKRFDDFYGMTWDDTFATFDPVSRMKSAKAVLVPIVYPLFNWHPWRFPSAQKWGDEATVAKFLTWFAWSRGYKSVDDWLPYPLPQLEAAGAKPLLPRLPELTRRYFPSATSQSNEVRLFSV